MSLVKTSLKLITFGSLLHLMLTSWVSAEQMRVKIIADNEVNKTLKFLWPHRTAGAIQHQFGVEDASLDVNKGTMDIWAKEGKALNLRNLLMFIETLGFAPIKEIEATIPGTVATSKGVPVLKVDDTNEIFTLSGDMDLAKLQGKMVTITGKVQMQDNSPLSIAVKYLSGEKK